MSSQTTTPSEQVRDALKRVQDEAAEMREQRAQAKKDRDAAKATFARDPSERNYERAQTAASRVEEFDERIEEKREEEVRLLRGLGSNGGGGGAATLTEVAEVLGDPAMQKILADAAGANFHIPQGMYNLGRIPREMVLSWTAGPRAQGGGTITAPEAPSRAPDIPTLTQPPTTFLSMLPSAPTETPMNPYLRREPTEGGVAPTEPGAIKPEVGWTYADKQANTQTIAGHVKIRRQDLEDHAGLLQAVRTDLIADLRVRLEEEVIAGTGEVSDVEDQPGLVGLLETTGLASVPLASDGVLLDAVLDAIAAIEMSGGQANFVAANTMDRATLLKMRDGSGSYVFDPSTSGLRVWGLTPVSSTRIPLGKVVVGDSRGLTVLIRTAPTITMGTDQDDHVRNKVTLVADLRAGLAVRDPSFFALIEVESD